MFIVVLLVLGRDGTLSVYQYTTGTDVTKLIERSTDIHDAHTIKLSVDNQHILVVGKRKWCVCYIIYTNN